ncbi:hypothetical protein NG800_018395 [Epilithonimonas ginsengisoli]|uniref:Amidohydrolase n=1 Tax=Epilithonimonas ginsengisoli TaxID=1245592 RepID=A0ABU4JMJ7_9FLAO|nr:MULTISPECIES: hypothetical protein [Chryseobacterium group]MBV6881845.1 hypothetical protein [Epilithonimonas sp. FP105]MDW8550903.1 hypothetical protein [Epilithonimonas ginsengisoli]
MKTKHLLIAITLVSSIFIKINAQIQPSKILINNVEIFNGIDNKLVKGKYSD